MSKTVTESVQVTQQMEVACQRSLYQVAVVGDRIYWNFRVTYGDQIIRQENYNCPYSDLADLTREETEIPGSSAEYSRTGKTIEGNYNITEVSDYTDLEVGMFVFGAGIPFLAKVTDINESLNNLTLSVPATAGDNSAIDLTFIKKDEDDILEDAFFAKAYEIDNMADGDDKTAMKNKIIGSIDIQTIGG